MQSTAIRYIYIRSSVRRLELCKLTYLPCALRFRLCTRTYGKRNVTKLKRTYVSCRYKLRATELEERELRFNRRRAWDRRE